MPAYPLAGLALFAKFAVNKLWDGVFNEPTDQRVENFTQSVRFDHRLFDQDIRASIAHAQMLAGVGLLSVDEATQIEQHLNEIGKDIEQGQFPFLAELEDIHMHIEQALIDRLGDVGRKLHTGRSRNDQVATDLRMWVREAIDQIDHQLKDLQQAFLGRATYDRDVILPAYTHLQRAQPVLAGHYWLAYCEKFERDRGRLSDCRARTNHLPLGTAALAGTSLPIDRDHVAKRLEFDQIMANSLDASSDRDFAVEFVFVLAMIAEHLSTWADEWVLWSTSEFNFLKLPQPFCTGSSIMPQKINPDVLELIRGKTARVVGNLQSLLMLIKGLPLAYNRDLQEDKPALFESYDTVHACLEISVPVVGNAVLNRQAIVSQLDRGYLDATTLMEYLIQQDIPQRTAHQMVGSLVRTASDRGIPLAQLDLEDFQQVHPNLTEEVFSVLGVQQAVNAFTSVGSTGRAQVDAQIRSWQTRLGV